ALHVAVLELEVPLERGAQRGEILVGARLLPGPQPERARAADLGRQLRRDPGRLLVVSASDANQAGLERLRIVYLLVRAQPLQQPADLGIDEPLVREPSDRGELLGARLVPGRRHLRPLVPEEQAARPV